MAWLKQFGHYHYWPLALRTIFVLGIARVAWDLVSIAACPPSCERRHGLLPHLVRFLVREVLAELS